MSKIKNSRLDQYGAEPFEQQQFGTAGDEGVKLCYTVLCLQTGKQLWSCRTTSTAPTSVTCALRLVSLSITTTSSHGCLLHYSNDDSSNITGCLTDQRVWFPGDIFTKIQQNLQFYRHLPGRVTNPWDHIDPVYPSNSSVKGHLLGIDSPNIN